MIGSETTSTNFFKGKWENSSAFSFNVDKKKFTTLLRGFDQLYTAQSGLGRIAGLVDGENSVFMPAHVGAYGQAVVPYSLLKAPLDMSNAVVVSEGTDKTFDWFVDGAFRPEVEAVPGEDNVQL